MAVITVRTTGAEHARWKDAAHAARTSLNEFCRAAIDDAADRWALDSPPIAAEAALDLNPVPAAWPAVVPAAATTGG